MANNILCIDAGNSAIKWALSNSDDLSESMSLPYPENMTADFIIEQWKHIEKPINVIASCVAADAIWQALVKACNELWGKEVQRVTSLKEGYGLTNAYDKPSDLGSDRWCAMIGVFHSTDSAFIIVDAGSALTIDMVNESGQHIGGYITPGLKMMKQSLGLQTAQINVDAEQNSTHSFSPANSTVECITAGIYLSVVKLIEAVYEKESKQEKKLECYLTGGDANLIAKLLSFKCIIKPDIVLRGLAEIQKHNQD